MAYIPAGGKVSAIRTLLHWLCAAGACWFTGAFIFVAAFSITYPYPLEWMEGQSIDVIARVVAGKSLYVEPSIDYVPFIYPPLYFYVAGALAELIGVDFTAARLVSFFSALGTGILIYCWVYKESGGKKAARIAAGLFYATYELSARWFDVGRIDSLYLFLLMSGLFIFFYYRDTGASILSGLLFTAAFFTKQNTLIAIAPLLFLGLFMWRRHTLITILTFAITSAAILYFYNRATDGWLNFYLFTLPAGHRIDRDFILGFWWGDLITKLWPLLPVILLGWWDMFCRNRKRAIMYLALAAGLVAAAYAGRLHRYGWTNVLMPMHVLLALATGIALSRWDDWRKILCLALVLVQMGLLFYNPLRNIPDEEAVAQGDAFVARMKALNGEVFTPEIQFIPTRAGKASFAYGLAAIDVLQSSFTDRVYVKDKLKSEMLAAITSQRFGAVITSGLIPPPMLAYYYRPVESIAFPRKFVSGFVSEREMQVYLPIDKSRPINNQLPNQPEPTP